MAVQLRPGVGSVEGVTRALALLAQERRAKVEREEAARRREMGLRLMVAGGLAGGLGAGAAAGGMSATTGALQGASIGSAVASRDPGAMLGATASFMGAQEQGRINDERMQDQQATQEFLRGLNPAPPQPPRATGPAMGMTPEAPAQANIGAPAVPTPPIEISDSRVFDPQVVSSFLGKLNDVQSGAALLSSLQQLNPRPFGPTETVKFGDTDLMIQKGPDKRVHAIAQTTAETKAEKRARGEELIVTGMAQAENPADLTNQQIAAFAGDNPISAATMSNVLVMRDRAREDAATPLVAKVQEISANTKDFPAEADRLAAIDAAMKESTVLKYLSKPQLDDINQERRTLVTDNESKKRYDEGLQIQKAGLAMHQQTAALQDLQLSERAQVEREERRAADRAKIVQPLFDESSAIAAETGSTPADRLAKMAAILTQDQDMLRNASPEQRALLERQRELLLNEIKRDDERETANAQWQKQFVFAETRTGQETTAFESAQATQRQADTARPFLIEMQKLAVGPSPQENITAIMQYRSDNPAFDVNATDTQLDQVNRMITGNLGLIRNEDQLQLAKDRIEVMRDRLDAMKDAAKAKADKPVKEETTILATAAAAAQAAVDKTLGTTKDFIEPAEYELKVRKETITQLMLNVLPLQTDAKIRSAITTRAGELAALDVETALLALPPETEMSVEEFKNMVHASYPPGTSMRQSDALIADHFKKRRKPEQPAAPVAEPLQIFRRPVLGIVTGRSPTI